MIDKSVIKLSGVKKILSLLTGLSALRAALIVLQAWNLSYAVTWLKNGGNITGVYGWAALFFVCFFGRQITVFVQDKSLSAFAAKKASDMRERLMEKIFTQGTRLVQKQGTGNITTMALEGTEQVETYIYLILSKLSSMMLIPVVVLVTVFVLDWISGLILLGVFPLIILFMIILGKAAQSRAEQQYKSFQILSNHFVDSLRGIETLKLFGISKQYGQSVFSSSERFRKATMQTLRLAILSGFALDFFCTLSVAIVAVGLGLRLLSGSMTLMPALTVLILSPEYFLPIRDFAGDYHATLDGKNAMTAMMNLLNETEPPIEEISLPPWNTNSTLDIDNISFSYPDFKAIQELSFKTRGFQKIGLIGMSGAGKSTFINLLGGFALPEAGTVKINGQRVNSFHLTDWQKQIIYIPQAPYIFHASLRENIAFYHPKADDNEILRAVDIMGLQDLLKELPEKLNTQIGGGARPLSGGQAQRIALARALLNPNCKILLFDEPTAHLDIETEVEMKEKMLPLMEGRLVFFATHRLHWMRDMDIVLVMENGRITEHGTHDELLKKNGAYTRLTRRIQGEE